MDFSAETLQARREYHDTFKVLKGKNLQPRILYPARLSFRIKGEIKSFSDKQKLKEFLTTKPTLQETLRVTLRKKTNQNKKDQKQQRLERNRKKSKNNKGDNP